MNRKRFYQKPLLWLIGVAVVSAGSGLAMLNLAAPTNVCETAADHQDIALRTRRYKIKGDIEQMRRQIENQIPRISTKIWGGKWRVAAAQDFDLNADKVFIHVEVPVALFVDDLIITLTKNNDAAIINVHSASRVGKSDLGENQRHVLQVLAKLDELFAAN